jgi:predicted amino acid racemase
VAAQGLKVIWLSDGSAPSCENTQVNQLAKHAAEIALRLAALPADGSSNNLETLDTIEQLAMRILQEVAAVRAAKSHPAGETTGRWPAMQPVRRQ